MSYSLPYGRILVKLDDGETDKGTIVESNCEGYRLLSYPMIYDEYGHPTEPDPPYHTHIVFCEALSVSRDVGGLPHAAMHLNAIVGFLD